MKFLKSVSFILTISVIFVGIAVPAAGAGSKIKRVSGEWTFDIIPGFNEVTAQEEYSMNRTDVLGDYVAYFTYKGKIEGLHMLMYSTYIYPDKLELVAVVRLHGKAFGQDIDVWGKQTLELTPIDESWSVFDITGSGKFMFPFKGASPCVLLRYYGKYWVDYLGIEGKEYATGTYRGVMVGSCE